MVMAVAGIEQVPPTICKLPGVKVCGFCGRIAVMVAVPPEIGMVRVRLLTVPLRLFAVVTDPVTARSVVKEGQLPVRLEARARNVPVTVLPLNWRAPVKSAMVPDESRCEVISQLPVRLVVVEEDVATSWEDEPQPRRMASGINKVMRIPGCMTESYTWRILGE